MFFPTARLRWIALFAGLALAISAVEVGVVHTNAFARRPDWLSVGVTFDLIVGLPLLYYYLIIRRLRVSSRTLLLAVSLSLVLTTLILPTGHRLSATLLRWGLPLIELSFVGYLLLRINVIRRDYHRLNAGNPDFTANLLQSLDNVMGPSPFNRVLVSELSVLRYGLLGWWLPVEKTATDTVFTSHRESGQSALTAGLLTVGMVETLLLHIFLHRWEPVVAWFATVVGIYGLLFFLADLAAIIKRPVLLRMNTLVLRFGLRGYGTVSTALIDRIETINDKPTRSVNTFNGAFLTTPNVLITLREPVKMTGALGIRRTVSQIALFIDDNKSFIHQLTA